MSTTPIESILLDENSRQRPPLTPCQRCEAIRRESPYRREHAGAMRVVLDGAAHEVKMMEPNALLKVWWDSWIAQGKQLLEVTEEFIVKG